ncbi:hypothetical protein OsJ_17744 [Oryza sativa Japonica Group]|uniref:Uncharacterized protein n=1 Tax=Oryza sativa subsp. japonica TaxID=39947 RepID=B9FNE7_ORYSJ|nr:hypothetical protein OsJ_17744 [Oryza sativa Japonica Group]
MVSNRARQSRLPVGVMLGGKDSLPFLASPAKNHRKIRHGQIAGAAALLRRRGLPPPLALLLRGGVLRRGGAVHPARRGRRRGCAVPALPAAGAGHRRNGRAAPLLRLPQRHRRLHVPAARLVRNPNRSPLAHYDSSLRVAYAGGEVGSMYIPAGQIDGGRTQYMATSFTVPAFAVTSSATAAASSSPAQTITVPASGPSPAAVGAVALQQEQPPPQQQQVAALPVMEVDSLLVVKGKVTILRVFTHHVVAAKVCRIGVSPADGRVLGFRC